jgi:hypothetical protein
LTSADPILTALDGQVECYRRLAKLAEMQHEFVQQSQTEQLLDVLGRRQEVLDRIATFERTIAPAKRGWPAYLGRLDAAQRGRAESLLDETRRLLEQITAADRNDALVLQQRKLNLGRQLNQAQNAKTLNRCYAAAAYATRPSRMDVQR